MDWDEGDVGGREPRPRNLQPMSVRELEEYIAALEGEITRVRAAIAAKQSLRAGADSLFRK
ncbi:hypothetical protein GALL_80400 [mine drainage metagenome]|uniref:Uncharacterized protein n=1 Tax=mine drainage metagenome TaxID=410659 RepID=A0A1J5T1J1_9ZZZZ